MNTSLAFNNGIKRAIAGALPKPAPTQDEVWMAVRDNPAAKVNFVRERTGATGDELTAKVLEYDTEMRKRYG